MIKKIFFTIALLLSFSLCTEAQVTNAMGSRERMIEFASRYEDSKDVISMVCTKGKGLNTFKLIMRGEYGKDFFKGVDIIIFVEYGEASAEQAKKITDEVETLCKDFEKLDIPEENIPEGHKIGTYIKLNSDNNITDMVVVLEDKEDKGITYFGGLIKLEDFKNME